MDDPSGNQAGSQLSQPAGHVKKLHAFHAFHAFQGTCAIYFRNHYSNPQLCLRNFEPTPPVTHHVASCHAALSHRESIKVITVDTEPFGVDWGPFAGTLDVFGA